MHQSLIRTALAVISLIVLAAAWRVSAAARTLGQDVPGPTTQPVTEPSTQPTTRPEAADDVLDRLLTPTTRSQQPPPAQPAHARSGAPNNATGLGAAAVAPDTPRQPLIAEGTYVIDRLVRPRASVDGRGLEIAFISDGAELAAAVEPPMLLAPNLSLMSLEAAVREEPNRLFRVTGRVTEYRGRNYLLLEKVVFLR